MNANDGERAAALARLPVGARVVSRDEERDGGAVRVVVGHRRGGLCMTAYEAPPPWMNGCLYLEDEADLVLWVGGEAPRLAFA
ncbi:MAG: hypothetical protein D6731_20555 [Planctomycetota bacterium]|nr:MAG: hypothetical protein D6731_20555 [Planctomycetota bacterium]